MTEFSPNSNNNKIRMLENLYDWHDHKMEVNSKKIIIKCKEITLFDRCSLFSAVVDLCCDDDPSFD